MRLPLFALPLLFSLTLAGCSLRNNPDASSLATTNSTTADTSTESGTETDPEAGGSETGGEDSRPARILVTSDWRAKRLSIVDYALIRDGSSREDALWKTIELDAFEPGPLEAELAPDGNTVVVAIAPGFFAGPVGGLAGAGQGQVPEGGALLVVDLETETVTAEFELAQYPMGIAFSDDGGAAWTANYGGNGQSGTTVSHIDLASLTLVEEVEVGPGPEQLDIRGGQAIVNTASNGAVRLFELADPQGSQSAPLIVSNDPSWVLFVGPGQDRAVAINSIGPPGYTLIDVGDPMVPAELETIEVVGIPYAGARAGENGEIVMSTIVGGEVHVSRYDTAAGELIDELAIPQMGFPLGLAYDTVDEIAVVPVPGANILAVVDFGAGDVREVAWQPEAGPTYVSLE